MADWQDALGGLLRGGSVGYLEAQSKRADEERKWSNELQKAIMLEGIKKMYSGSKPEIRTVGNSLVQVNPETGKATTIMEAPEKPTKPTYQTVGGKILQMPDKPDGQPSVVWEDPEVKKSQKTAYNTVIKNTQDMLNNVKKVREYKEFFGPAGDLPSHAVTMFGLDKEKYKKRTQWEAEVQRLMAQQMIAKLMELKSASKTGSTGFGQLTEREGRKIQEAATALNRGLDPDVADQYLQQMEDSLNIILNAAQNENFNQDTMSLNQENNNQSFPIQPPLQSPASTPSRPVTSASAKVTMARRLREKYPNATKQQIIDMVNKGF